MVLCACSGGPDSTALLHVVASLRRRIGHTVVAHGVDHRSSVWRAANRSRCGYGARACGAICVDESGGTNRLQSSGARARERLKALGRAAMACNAHAIATGHTADDRAETLLMRLLRATDRVGSLCSRRGH